MVIINRPGGRFRSAGGGNMAGKQFFLEFDVESPKYTICDITWMIL